MSKLKLGMVGWGQGAFIGSVHRIASRIDDHYELVAGSLASNPEVAHSSAKELGIAEDRSYSTYLEMAEKESNLENGIDVVVIVNHILVLELLPPIGVYISDMDGDGIITILDVIQVIQSILNS